MAKTAIGTVLAPTHPAPVASRPARRGGLTHPCLLTGGQGRRWLWRPLRERHGRGWPGGLPSTPARFTGGILIAGRATSTADQREPRPECRERIPRRRRQRSSLHPHLVLTAASLFSHCLTPAVLGYNHIDTPVQPRPLRRLTAWRLHSLAKSMTRASRDRVRPEPGPAHADVDGQHPVGLALDPGQSPLSTRMSPLSTAPRPQKRPLGKRKSEVCPPTSTE